MELAAHFALERLIDNLVLLDAGLAAKRFGDDGCGVMVAVASQIADRHLRIRYARADQAPDIARSHRHDAVIQPLGQLPDPNIAICAMSQPQCGGWRQASMWRRLQAAMRRPPLNASPPYRPAAMPRNAASNPRRAVAARR